MHPQKRGSAPFGPFKKDLPPEEETKNEVFFVRRRKKLVLSGKTRIFAPASLDGGIGRHACFRYMCRKVCWFESSSGHHDDSRVQERGSFFIAPFFSLRTKTCGYFFRGRGNVPRKQTWPKTPRAPVHPPTKKPHPKPKAKGEGFVLLSCTTRVAGIVKKTTFVTLTI